MQIILTIPDGHLSGEEVLEESLGYLGHRAQPDAVRILVSALAQSRQHHDATTVFFDPNSVRSRYEDNELNDLTDKDLLCAARRVIEIDRKLDGVVRVVTDRIVERAYAVADAREVHDQSRGDSS